MKIVILKSMGGEIPIKVKSKQTALEEARKYVRENLNRKNYWLAYYEGKDLLGSASENRLYSATDLGEVYSFESAREANGQTLFYTKKEALNKREAYRTDAEKLLNESTKRLKDANVKLTVIHNEDDFFSFPRIAVVVEVEGYEFSRFIDE